MPGDQLTRGLVCKKKAHELVTTGRPRHPGIPCATVYDLLRALSGDRAFLSPSSARIQKHPRQLRASVEALRPHGFVVRGSAFVSCTASVHRIPLPTSVTIAIRPSRGNGTIAITKAVSTKSRSEIFFARGLVRQANQSLLGRRSRLLAEWPASLGRILRNRHRQRRHYCGRRHQHRNLPRPREQNAGPRAGDTALQCIRIAGRRRCRRHRDYAPIAYS
jgi:hypothetical protein